MTHRNMTSRDDDDYYYDYNASSSSSSTDILSDSVSVSLLTGDRMTDSGHCDETVTVSIIVIWYNL